VEVTPLRAALARPGVRSGDEVVMFRSGGVWYQIRFVHEQRTMRYRLPDGGLTVWSDGLIDADHVERVEVVALADADKALRSVGTPPAARILMEALEATLAAHPEADLDEKMKCIVTVAVAMAVRTTNPAIGLTVLDNYFHQALRGGAEYAKLTVVEGLAEEVEAIIRGVVDKAQGDGGGGRGCN
jgi:hypothetical protein